MSSLSPIEQTRKTLSAQVYERIRAAIVQQILTPGQRIDQNKLADDLQVSLVPVREALKTLEAEGLVSIIPRRGAFVTELSLKDLADLYFARQLIEGEATYQAVDRMTAEHFGSMERLAQQMREATDHEDLTSFMQLNRQFHMTIYSALNNEHIVQTIQGLWERSEIYRFRYMFISHGANSVHDEHAALLRACRQGDAQMAKDLAKQHIAHTQIALEYELLNHHKDRA
jgi:DNA-binding GntR family transcriptional regulator